MLLGVFFLFSLFGTNVEASELNVNNLDSISMVRVAKMINENYDTSSMTNEELDNLTINLLNQNLSKNTRSGVASPGKILNKREKELAKKYPSESVNCFFYADIASNAARKTFSNATTDGTDGNAFQHFYWNILMTDRYGAVVAERWGTAHEYGTSGPYTQMDLANNAAGRNTYNDCRNFTIGLMGRRPVAKDMADWTVKMIFNRRLYKLNSARTGLTATTGAGYTGKVYHQ
ncbi:hypothetical protein JZO66_07575 [Enterococcus sp. DIV0242_7C1]|uniref:DUF6973 domain-containing protein n=1 Tax=Candidatus Enterococcus dunnyi TaxID=1834192 RepID=A0A200J071_9ENTE|nr:MULTISPECIES: hypothetical protein [unclassified Enterococcus]MBO0470402.1 hypothetical protein [Enterococcus sp. DIV0242_7C1]OUZ30229.1 hypothetical protein A5889_002517 [Enterococcus sp. 9D6_DIV0238]